MVKVTQDMSLVCEKYVLKLTFKVLHILNGNENYFHVNFSMNTLIQMYKVL